MFTAPIAIPASTLATQDSEVSLSAANMDYPGDDSGFCAIVDREVHGFLDRTQLACSVAVLCGNSEVEQQAAMMGAPRELWRSPLFSEMLAKLSNKLRPDIPYWPSTPS